MSSVTRPSLQPRERAPVGSSLDHTANRYYQHCQPTGQLLIHPTTTRQSDASDWTVRHRRPDGAPALPPLSVWRAGLNSHIPSSEPIYASHQTYRQTDFSGHQTSRQPSHAQPFPSYADHPRRLQGQSEAIHYSVLEHHPIVRSQRRPPHPDDHTYSSPVLEYVPSWTGVDETESEGDIGVHLPIDSATLPPGSRALAVIISPKERRPHKCPHEDCQMSFPRPSALRTHLNKHTGDKRKPNQFLSGNR